MPAEERAQAIAGGPEPGGAKQIPLSAPDITEDEIAAVTRVLRSGRLSLGPELEGFETALARYHGGVHAVAVSSGTAGLHMALLALEIGAGDEVIVPSFTFIAVANAVLLAGATPVFADIDAATLNLDPAAVEQAITPRTRAVIVVHTFGVPAEMDALLGVARRHGLRVIEDACEAIGAEWGEPPRKAGTLGDVGVLGFYPNKQITTGEGGAVLAHDAALAGRLRRLRNQGRAMGAGWLEHAEVGWNYRLAEMACALGRVQMGRLAGILASRRRAAERYEGLLAGIPGLRLPALRLAARTVSWFVYVVRLEDRQRCDRVEAALGQAGITTGRYFAPIHQQAAWQGKAAGWPPTCAARLPVTESIAGRTLALPFFTCIGPTEQERVAGQVRQALARV